MTTLSISTFKFQLFVNDFDELCLFHDLKFTLILVWSFPWVIPISSAYFFSNYFNIIIFLIILISSSWWFFFSFSILNYINIVIIIINVIVRLNYIFWIIIKKKHWLKEKWQNNLNKIVKSFFGIYTQNNHFLKQFIQTLNVALKIKNAYFHIFTKRLFAVFKMMFSKCMF